MGLRRMAVLFGTPAAMANTRTPAEACHTAAESLSKARRDLPFSVIYLASDEGNELRRCGLTGIGNDHPGAPPTLDLEQDTVWPIREVMETGQPVLVEDLGVRFSDL